VIQSKIAKTDQTKILPYVFQPENVDLSISNVGPVLSASVNPTYAMESTIVLMGKTKNTALPARIVTVRSFY
jgi:hypothetical protein